MKNCIIRVVTMVFCMIIFCQHLCVFQAKTFSSDLCNLTLIYTQEETVFSDLEIRIYRVAEITSDGSYEKLSQYNQFPVEVNGITSQTEWNDIAMTLKGYVKSAGTEPDRMQKTDTNGNAVFENIEPGLYLVEEVTVEKDGTVYNFYDFMLSVYAEEDNRNVVAKPKSEQKEPMEKEKIYTILKLWQDEDNSKKRPTSVTVDIIKNGVTVETVILDSNNNWQYIFKSSAETTDLTIAERNVPEGYKVKVTEKETMFIIVNILDEPEDDDPPDYPDNPQTGDSYRMHIFMTILMCVSGMLTIISGVGRRRKDDAQKK